MTDDLETLLARIEAAASRGGCTDGDQLSAAAEAAYDRHDSRQLSQIWEFVAPADGDAAAR